MVFCGFWRDRDLEARREEGGREERRRELENERKKKKKKKKLKLPVACVMCLLRLDE
jgi:hypothetical protein